MNCTQRGLAAWTAAAALAVIALPAHADVVNGGFETGSFAGWTQTGDTSFSGVDPIAARSGAFGAYFGPIAAGGISQSFATVANQPYRVTFSLSLVDTTTPNSFSWSWNGVAQTPGFTNASRFSYTDFAMNVLATGASSTLAFTFTNPQSFWQLDNVSVVAVPELPVAALLGAGGFLLLLLARKGRASSR